MSNGLDFSTPVTPQPVIPVSDPFTNYFRKAEESLGKFKQGSDISYSTPSDVDVYASQDNFKSKGFDPKDPTNYSRYATYETHGSALEKSFEDFNYKFKNSFVEGIYSTGRVLRSIFTLGEYGINKDESDLLAQYFKDQENEKKTNIFLSPEDNDRFFNKQLWKDFIGNAGFALGTIAEIALETALTWGVGELSSVAIKGFASSVKGAGTLSRTAAIAEAEVEAAKATASKTASVINKVEDVANEIKTAKEVSAAPVGQFTNVEAATRLSETGKSGAMGRLVSEMTSMIGGNITDIANASTLYNKIWKATENFVPVVGDVMRTGREISILGKEGMTAGKVAKVSFNGFRRGLHEMVLSTSESALESSTAYGDSFVTLYNQFKQDNDRDPNPSEEESIKKTAMNIAAADFRINELILLASNRIQFGNLFSKFTPTNKVIRGMMLDDAKKSAVIVSGVVEDKLKTKAYATGIKNLSQISKDFGIKKAAWESTKRIGRNFAKFEGTEGVQEILQDVTSVSAKDYYMSMYNAHPISVTDSIEKAFGGEMNMQGLKTFMIGALTGGLIHPVVSAGEHISEKIANKVEGVNPEEQKKVIKDNLDAINMFLSGTDSKIKEHAKRIREQTKASENMSDAAAIADAYSFNNSSDDALVSAIVSAKRLGMTDALIDHIRKTGDQFNDDQFKEAYEVDVKDTKYNSSKEFVNKIADDIEQFSKTYDSLITKFGPIMDPLLFAENSKDRIRAAYAQNALLNAIGVLSSNSIKGSLAAKRAKQVAADITAIPELASSAEYSMRVLSDFHTLHSEIGLMVTEYNTLKKSYNSVGGKDLKQQMDLKKEEIDSLNEWLSFWYESENTGEVNTTNEKKDKQLKYTFIGTADHKKFGANEISEQEFREHLRNEKVAKLFSKIINIKNKQSGINTSVRDSVVTDSIDKIVDYIRLSKDSKDFINATDLLLDPKNFLKLHQRLTEGEFKASINDVLRAIYDTLIPQLVIRELKAQLDKGEDILSDMENNYQKTLSDITKRIEALPEFIKVWEILHDDGLGIEQIAVAQEYLIALRTAINKEFNLETEQERQEKQAKRDKEDADRKAAEEKALEEVAKKEKEKQEKPKSQPVRASRKTVNPIKVEEEQPAEKIELTPEAQERVQILESLIRELFVGNMIPQQNIEEFNKLSKELNEIEQTGVIKGAIKPETKPVSLTPPPVAMSSGDIFNVPLMEVKELYGNAFPEKNLDLDFDEFKIKMQEFYDEYKSSNRFVPGVDLYRYILTEEGKKHVQEIANIEKKAEPKSEQVSTPFDHSTLNEISMSEDIVSTITTLDSKADTVTNSGVTTLDDIEQDDLFSCNIK